MHILNTNLENKQNKLGYTPVRQGGGTGQSSNTVMIGWSNGSRLKATVDSTDLGNFVFDSQLNAKLPTSAVGSQYKPIYWNGSRVTAGKCAFNAGSTVKSVSGTGSFRFMSSTDAGALVGVSAATNANSIMLVSNGDYNAWNTTFVGAFYYDNGWYVSVSTTDSFSNRTCRINYLLVYFG